MPILESAVLFVELEEDRPRVVRYRHKPTGVTVNGIVEGRGALDYLWLRHNYGLAGPREFVVRTTVQEDSVVYTIVLKHPQGHITFDMPFTVEGDTLHVGITHVVETGTLQLIAVDMETLSMVSNEDDSWSICSSLWENVPFEAFHHGMRRYFDFVAFVREALAVAVYSNKPFLPAGIDWVQRFPTATTSVPIHVLRFPVYSYRLDNEIQPDFHGAVGFLTDRNGDGHIDYQDICHWIRDFHTLSVHPLYRHSWVFKISMAFPPDMTYTTWEQASRMIRELAARTEGTTPAGSAPFIVYLSGWQHEGHDSGWPSGREVCTRCGSLEQARALIEQARQLGVIVSLHVNWDDMYADSPEFTPDIAAIGRDGEMLKGGLWGGGQAFVISAYKDYQSGSARRRMRALLDLLPLRDTIHFDVLSSAPYTESFDTDGYISQMKHLVLGKWKIIAMFRNEAGLDVSSEFYTRPFMEQLRYLWGLGGGYEGRVHRYLLHGGLIYGGGSGCTRSMEHVREVIFDRAARGAGIGCNFDASTPVERMADLYYLAYLPYRALADKRIRHIEDHDQRIATVFEDGSATQGDRKTGHYQVSLCGRVIAQDYTTFVALEPDRYVAYALDKGTVEYPAPPGWPNGAPTCACVDRRIRHCRARAECVDGTIRLFLPAHEGIWIRPAIG